MPLSATPSQSSSVHPMETADCPKPSASASWPHVEALKMPTGVMFYLEDADQKPLTVDGYTGNAVVKGPSGVVTVELMAMGDHLHAPAVLLQGQPATAVLTLKHDGKASSASFETQAVGLPSHDHPCTAVK